MKAFLTNHLKTFVMVVCAYIWFWLGLSNYYDLPRPTPGVAYLALDPDLRAGLWWGGAIVGLATAWSREKNRFGLLALMYMPAFVITCYTISYIYARVPGGHEGMFTAWYQCGVYLSLPALVVIAALVPAPPVKIVSEAPRA